MKRTQSLVLRIFLILLSLTLIAAIAMTVWTGLAVADGVLNQTDNETTTQNAKAYLDAISFPLDEFKSNYQAETIAIPSTRDTHSIPADYLKTDQSDRRGCVILVHGLGGTRSTTYPVAQIFLDLGYDVLAYDQANSGENTAPYNSFGFWESYDLLDCVNYVDEKLTEDQRLIAWGTSFGGATVGIALGRDDSKIDGAILDCPISDGAFLIETVLEQISRETSLPLPYMMWSGNLAMKLKHGFSFQDLLVTDWIKTSTTPTLIFHSKVDKVTPFFMGQDLFDAIGHENKQLVTSESSPHAELYSHEPEMYRDAVTLFLSTYAL